QGLAALGASDIQLLSLEVAQGVATVNLSIDARRLEPERLHMLRAAIVDSLIELGGIDGVNVLIVPDGSCIMPSSRSSISTFT
ncbi:GerMN domain-containing protein, partial [Acinetobacter baumannii]|nr:GerMN domain-containing protein [Acinetobacter baumannii]